MSKFNPFSKPVLSLSVGLMCSALLGACGAQKDLSDMHDATMDMRTQTTEMNGRMKGMSDTTEGMSKTTGGMAKTTNDMSKTTNHMAQTTDHMDQITGGMAKTTNHMSETTDQMARTTNDMAKTTSGMAQVTSGMAVTTGHMAETTDGMAKDMQAMKAKTNELSDTSNRLDAKTGELYDALKQDNANKSRQEGMKLILAAKETPHKISEATKYFWAFEFQVWSGMGQDTPEKRLELAAVGVREFLNDVSECMSPGQTEVDPLAFNQAAYVLSNPWGNKNLCLNALAAALHEINLKQKILLEQHPELKKLSMLTLIEAAFRAKAEMVEKGKQLNEYPQFITEVLMRKNVAALILQARYNFLGTMVLGLSTDIQGGMMSGLKMMYSDFNLDISSKDPAEVSELTGYLKSALELRAFMLKVGLKPELTSGLVGVLKHATLLDSSSQADFNKLFETYRNGNDTPAEVPADASIAPSSSEKPAVLPAPSASIQERISNDDDQTSQSNLLAAAVEKPATEKQSWWSWLKSKITGSSTSTLDASAQTP